MVCTAKNKRSNLNWPIAVIFCQLSLKFSPFPLRSLPRNLININWEFEYAGAFNISLLSYFYELGLHRNTVIKQLQDKYFNTSIKQNTSAGFFLFDFRGIMYEDLKVINRSLS